VKIFPLIRAELARLTSSRIGVASLIALMTVPLVYGGLYLWGNQDPYSSLARVPAALVVQDTGTTRDGIATNYGKKAAESLLEGGKFGWVEVTATQAAAGVKNGSYDFGITFPSDFSVRLASASGNSPRSAQLQLTTDDTNSYLSTTIAKQAAEAVRVEIAKEVGGSASITLLNAIGDIRDGVVKAEDGASSLADGAITAASGAASLSSGTISLASGAASLSSGLADLDAKASSLPTSAAQLKAGAAALATGLAMGAQSGNALRSGAATAASLAPQAAQQQQIISALTLAGATPETIVQVRAQLAGLATATAQVSAGVSSQLVPSLAAAATGSTQLATGTAALSAAAPALSSAVHSASTGAASLSHGAGELLSGASALASGTGELASGSSTLTSSLSDAARTVPVTTAAGRRATADLIANPIAVKQTAITQAANYGAGLAPFFLALASWIGIYALFLLVRPLSRRALTAVQRPIRTTLAGWLTPALLGVVQMAALFALVTLVLHLPASNPIGMLAFMAFVAATFAAIVLALNVLLGSVGQFLALIFMVVQLVTAGGTFPWQTLPRPLAALHQVLPMSHAVDGIRQLMYGGLSSTVWSSIVPLALWLVGSLVVSVLGAMRQGRFRILRELRPSPIGA